ncbi:MAG: DUF429 domain-containing protein [Anaerolineales bacterium]|nr:DUF429 domain-containing protein [Anaerolineales bacterium]
MSRFLGIDFSGNHLMWRPGRRRSNVWIADVRKIGERLVLKHLMRVQELPSDEHPLERLAALLREGEFETAAIDSPFSVPRKFIPPEGYAGLLERIGSLSDPDGRPFCRSVDFVKAVAGVDPPLNPPQPRRSTDAYWSQKGLNVRSTLWAGARGGAAMTAACFKLLHRAQRPIWPWVQESRGLLVEAFPMAQLKQWGLPYNRYGMQDRVGELLREQIIEGIRERIDLGVSGEVLVSSADALDSVLCAFSGLAVKTSSVAVPPDDSALLEGWMAVHA